MILILLTFISCSASQSTSVFLDDLTTFEVKEKIENGWDTVLIPTGGTEQNGPHMALGKHNFIIKHNAEKVAKSMGKTLVAPVISHVPEGEINPPTGHMPYAGTISVPMHVFQQIIEYTALSLHQHGIKWIFFIGDSRANQFGQATVAEKLRARGMRVYTLSDYYEVKRRIDYLKSKNYQMMDIGGHAGMLDTSELMVISPKHVNLDKVYKHPSFSGDPKKSSMEIGKELIRIKVEGAIEQIKKIKAKDPSQS